ncbi:uncharacterized protein LY89DRAFT_249194 [Mollisia scopiformis]|uniref:Uncharacterized protein n=1 Tax=Mollisia scopiformis TaxID=149040 RepID=A0A194WSV1_MOLSC|nr:uncharacterized protein LY89DRAFT_249194 [Mollisia scopiformis]KUJ10697.1 hypothetical protein LY89DRAFT_249194 [Mollisia scopiformis]
MSSGCGAPPLKKDSLGEKNLEARHLDLFYDTNHPIFNKSPCYSTSSQTDPSIDQRNESLDPLPPPCCYFLIYRCSGVKDVRAALLDVSRFSWDFLSLPELASAAQHIFSLSVFSPNYMGGNFLSLATKPPHQTKPNSSDQRDHPDLRHGDSPRESNLILQSLPYRCVCR